MTDKLNSREYTAHELWDNQLHAELVEILFPKRIREGKSFYQTSRATQQHNTEKVLGVTRFMNTTRFRTVVDALVAEAQNQQECIKGFANERRSIQWWQFAKLRKNRIKINQHQDMLFAYQKAIKIVVNTKPAPVIESPVKKAEEHVHSN